MKNLKLLFFVALFYICAIGNAQTPAPKGTYYPNATKSDTLSSNTRVPVFNENNILNKYVSIDSLSNYIVSEVGETVVVENEYANMTTMYADQASQTDSFIQYVEDASAHPNITSGSAYFEYLGTTNGNNTDYRVLSESEYGYVTLSGNQTITGRKIFQTTGTGYAALFQTLGLGSALVASTNGFGSAAFLQSTSAAQSLRLQSTGVGKLLTFENESVQTGYVDKNANIKANSINIGGNGNNVMLDNGSVTPLSSLLTTPATVSEINTGTNNTKMITPLGLAGSDYFTKTQNDTYYKPIGYVPAWTEITGKPTTTSYFTNNGADNTSTYVEHDEISGLVLEPPFLKELVPDTYLPSTTGNFILRGSYFTPSMSVVVEGHTINYKTFISSNEVIVNLTTSATEGLYDVTLNNGISVTYNDQLQVVNGTVFQPTSNDWENIINNLDVSNVGNPKFTVINSVSSGQWKQIIDYTKDFKIQFKLSKSPLGFNISGEEPFLYLKSSIDNSNIFTLFLRKDASTIINFRVSSETDIIDYANTLVGSGLNTIEQNFDLVSENSIEFRYINGIMYFYYNNVLKRTFTHVLAENLNLAVALRWWDLTDIKYIDLSDTSGGYTDYSKLISQFENDANYLQDAPSNGNEYVRKDGDWQVATGGGSGHTIQDNGVSKTARTNLNFKNFVVDDNAANNSTDITAVVAGAPLTYNYTAVGAETSINTGVSIASNYQTEIYYGNAVLSPTIDYTLSYGATTTINFTFPLEAGYPIRVVYNSSSAPNAITDSDDVPEGTTNLYADANATNQGNTFNGANQLVKLDGTGKLPAIDGSNLTNLPSSGDMLKSENLSGLANYSTARSNLGLVIGTNVLAPNGSAAGLTGFPTLNQNTTGSAATLTTPRTINGTSFNGSANITTTNWGTSRNISIGGTSKAVTGGANVTWTQSEIGVNKSTIDALGINATTTTTSTSTGTAIDMGYKRQMNFGAASSASTFTLTNIAVGGYAEVLINGTTEPTVTGATKLPDTASWVTGTDMVLCVKDFNGTRKYWFVKF